MWLPAVARWQVLGGEQGEAEMGRKRGGGWDREKGRGWEEEGGRLRWSEGEAGLGRG